MRGGNIYLWSYLNGLFASLGGCTLPVLSVIAARLRDQTFNRWKFLAEFFVVQFLLFSALNIATATVYSLFETLQPILLLFASLFTFILATSLALNKPLPLPSGGGIYGIALSPCSIGFAIATSATSVDYITAVGNALAFSLGIVTPIAAIAIILKSAEPLLKRGDLLEKVSIALLYLVSAYLAYLAGSSWRWLP